MSVLFLNHKGQNPLYLKISIICDLNHLVKKIN